MRIFWLSLMLVFLSGTIAILVASLPREFVIETKPYSLKRFDEYNDIVARIPAPGDGYITDIHVEVLGAPPEVLHHIVLLNSGKQDVACPRNSDRFFAAGTERTPMQLPEGYGYFVGRGDTFRSTTHIVNITGQAYPNVKIKTRITFVPRTALNRLIEVTPIFLDIDRCSKISSFIINPTSPRDYSLSSPVKIPFDARLVITGGHIHEYGRELKVLLDGKEILKFVPQKEKEKIVKMPVISNKDNPIKLKVGQQLDMVASYEATDISIEGMGISLLFLVREYDEK